MKIYYVLSIVAAAVVSTTVGTNLVAADTSVTVAQAAPVQSTSLERLKAQSDSALTWRRPL